MNSDTEFCIRTLAKTIEENEDGSWTYSGSNAVRKQERLIPIILEELGFSAEQFRVSIGQIESEFSNLVLDAKNSEKDPSRYVREKLDSFREGLYEKDLEEYWVAFPLNYHRSDSDFLPNIIKLDDVVFKRLPRVEWEKRFLPNIEGDELTHQEGKLSRFLNRSPNDITNWNFTFWFAKFKARDKSYAVNHVGNRLEILLGMLNYSMMFGKIQTTSFNQGPWPARWADLREPFVYLLHSKDGFICHYWSQDATLRKSNRIHSLFREGFEELVENLPTFEEESPLDARLFNGFRAFQAAITNPIDRESFFEFWRGIEILSLVGKYGQMSDVVERATALSSWDEERIGEIRAKRAVNKRNKYVHEGAGLRVTRADRNLAKTILEHLIDLYIDKRTEWDIADMKFVLNEFTENDAKVQQLRNQRKREIKLLDWMEQVGAEN